MERWILRLSFCACMLACAPVFAAGAEPYGYGAALNPARFEASPAGGPVTVVEKGEARAVVVVADGVLKDKQAAATTAARELVEHVRLATGATLAVVEAEQAPAGGPLILVGESALSRSLGLSAGDLPPEGFRVLTFERGDRAGVMIAGPGAGDPSKAPKGTLWGVYDWLERFLGVRWYYPGADGRVVPQTPDLVIRPVHYTDAPVTLKRDMYIVVQGLDWRTMMPRYRVGNSSPVPFTPCHTPGSWSVHADHPETFELQPDGKRNMGMPCYGNPKTAELYLEDIERFYETGDAAVWKHPSPNVTSSWFPPSRTVIPISPPDKGVECRCEFCQPLYDSGADRHGRASRVVAHHVRLVAQGVRKRWPDKLVWYLPYSNYTVPPPDLELPDNVVVGVCLMRGAANAKEPELAKVHDDWIAGWRRITGRKVHLWEYLCWPADDTALPFQYPHVLQSFYARHRENVEGSFINTGYPPEGLAGGNFASFHPTMYCWMRVMWNPEFDVDAALEEHAKLMYGPAAEPMGALIQHLIRRWEDTRWSELSADHHISPKQVHEETMPRAEAGKLAAWLAGAREAAGEEGLHRRRVDFLGGAVDIFLKESADYHDQSGVPVLPVLKVGAPPHVDGKLDEPCWRDAVAQPFVRAQDPKNPRPEAATTVQGVWTGKGVVFGFRFSEPAPDKIRTERTRHDQDVYWDDCIEIFLDPAGERSAYCQIIVNALGTVFDRHSQQGTEWQAEGVERAAHVGRDFWSMEVFVPYSAFPGKVGEPPIGGHWYGNFIRSRFAGGPWQLTRWSTKYRASNLDFSAFGKLKFVE